MPDDAYDPAAVLSVLAGMEPPPRRPAGDVEDGPRYPSRTAPAQGSASSSRCACSVGTERSTIVVADPLTGRALAREVVPHGGEAGAAAAAVEAAIRARMQSAPGGVPGGLPEAPGEPIE